MKSTIISNEKAIEIIKDIQAMKSQVRALQKIEEKLKQELYNYMGEHDVMINHETGEEFVHWTYSEGYMKFDAKKFQQEKPNVYKKYLFQTEPVRTLRITK